MLARADRGTGDALKGGLVQVRTLHEGTAREAAGSCRRDFVPLQFACLSDYSELIPDTLEAVAGCAPAGSRIGSTRATRPR